MEHRPYVAGTEIEVGRRSIEQGEHVAVSHLDALRQPRRTRRIDHVGTRIRRHRNGNRIINGNPGAEIRSATSATTTPSPAASQSGWADDDASVSTTPTPESDTIWASRPTGLVRSSGTYRARPQDADDRGDQVHRPGGGDPTRSPARTPRARSPDATARDRVSNSA